jgi:phosphate/sulfate permease
MRVLGASIGDRNLDLREGWHMSVARGLVGGVACGVLGAAAWTAITYFSGYELGIVAWLVGVGVGVGVALGMGGKGRPMIGVMAALLAFVTILGGKVATAHFAAQDYIHTDGSDMDEMDLFNCYVDKVALEYEGNGTDLSEPVGDAVYPPEVVRVAEARWAAMGPDEREAFRAEWFSQRTQELEQNSQAVMLMALLWSFSPYDLLWMGLAVASAYRLGARDLRKNPEGEGVLQAEKAEPVAGGGYFASLGSPTPTGVAGPKAIGVAGPIAAAGTESEAGADRTAA